MTSAFSMVKTEPNLPSATYTEREASSSSKYPKLAKRRPMQYGEKINCVLEQNTLQKFGVRHRKCRASASIVVSHGR